MIKDAICFERKELVVYLPLMNGEGTEEFILDMNFSTLFFFRLLNTYQRMLKAEKDIEEEAELIQNIAVDILNLDKRKSISIVDVKEKYDDYNMLYVLFTICINQLNKLMNDELFSLPEVKLKTEEKVSTAEKKLALLKSEEVEVMESVAFVTEHSSSSYEECMSMPYTAFQAILKHLRLSQLMQNAEWREEYAKEKYKIELKKKAGVSSNSTNSKQKANIADSISQLRKMGEKLNG